MIGEDRVRKISEGLLDYSSADQTEVAISIEESALTRFANSAIHQNVMETNADVRVRAVVGKRTGVATGNTLDPAALRRLVDSAVAMAGRQPENPDFVSLPRPRPVVRLGAWDDAVANCAPETRARAVQVVCELSLSHGLSAAGAMETGSREYSVANSLGVFSYDTQSKASLNAVVMSDTGSGYSESNHVFLSEIDAGIVAREAVEKALNSRDPVDVPPGEYVVLLEEYAVAEMLAYFAYAGLGALSVQEGRSFMNGRIGTRIADPSINFWDDGSDLRGFPWAFDYEGVPKTRVDFITAGVASGVVYDSYTAHREGRESTGHALPAPNSYGPQPVNLVLGTGSATKEEMLKSVERGLWVTRFHYVNILHESKAILTGMTRDGTFLIEKGEIAGPVRDLRFTQGVLEALSSVRMVGREAKLAKSASDGGVVPALLVDRFRFTGATRP